MVSPATTPTVRGRKSGMHTVRPVKATKSPFSLMAARNAGPLLAPGRSFTAIAIRMGTKASARSIAHVRRRRKSTDSSDPRSARGRTEGGADSGTACTGSARDIEALPGQGHEAVLEGLPADRDTTDADARIHERGGDLLGPHLAVEDRRHGAVPALVRLQPEASEHVARRLIVGGEHADASRPLASQLLERALGDEPAGAHDAD